MVDKMHREMMSELYRLWERYENPPKVIYTEDSVEYWKQACSDVMELHEKYAPDPVAQELLLGFYNGLSENWKVVNPNPTIDRPAEPEQLEILF